MLTNNVVLVGRFAQTPILKIAENNNYYSAFILMISKFTKDPKKIGVLNAVMLPDPIKVECFVLGELAEQICVYAVKGCMICIEGHLEWREYYDKRGVKMSGNYVMVDKVTFLSSPYGEVEVKKRKKFYKEIVMDLRKNAKERRKKK